MIHLHVRERLESEEEERLSPFAVKSRRSRGRDRYEEPSPVRTEFQRDRDRLIHSKAFRRLKHKTQVFIAPAGDHYVTRLTHTLEVSQIARTVARALRLNEDLTEAIALGHDLGHTPFGHVGEDVLNELFPGGFRHNEQSLRVVEVVENGGQGLNLTWEVRDGILNHSKPRESLMGQIDAGGSTLEARVCKLADSVAYINHDTADAIRAGLIGENDLPGLAVDRLGRTSSERINTLVIDIIDYAFAGGGLAHTQGEALRIGMSRPVLEAADTLRDFLFREVYTRTSEDELAQEAREVVRFLYRHFVEHPGELPAELQAMEGSAARKAVDYVAGMTDQFALNTAKRLEEWKIERF
ncbi:MAG: deoxyguanosinetriphosphate triphosphohydrolase [Chloroflexi bacterium]|nr:deoxyguanosinetriphosphate triphosphohydrolase [Chloroflexota bacterium]